MPGRGRFQKVQGLFRFSPYSPLSDNGNIPAADINNRSDLAPFGSVSLSVSEASSLKPVDLR